MQMMFIHFEVIYLITFAVAFLAFIAAMPVFLKVLRHIQWHEPLKADNADLHGHKVGTFSSGGFLILVLTVFVLSVFNQSGSQLTPLLLVCIAMFGFVGLIDDGLKIKTGQGLRSKTKFLLLCLVGIAVYVLLPINPHFEFAAWLFALSVLVGSSNAVNLTDGVDGLATSTVIVALVIFTLSLLGVNHWFSHLPVTTVSLLITINFTLMGVCLGFLCFNKHPAIIFMGDTGSLALGGYLAILALMSQSPWSYALVGGVFVLEVLSVIVQVASFKITGKRVFKRAPIHHHFEKIGWDENTIVICFSFIGLCGGLAALFWF
jgi:phospho-N-acetylmuramoyl-pentapeptide-transferase